MDAQLYGTEIGETGEGTKSVRELINLAHFVFSALI